jgi:hypothetical protein
LLRYFFSQTLPAEAKRRQGQGEKEHSATPPINLSTNQLLFNSFSLLTLSYPQGGSEQVPVYQEDTGKRLFPLLSLLISWPRGAACTKNTGKRSFPPFLF